MFIRLILLVGVVLIFAGCADVKTPTAQYALTHPLSTKTMVVSGTSKEEVIEKWGEPNDVIDMGFDDTGLKKEAWIYEAWFPNMPLDHRHFSRRKKIYFIGDHVTGYEDIEDVNEKEKE
ncbi:MAG: hypothetical protein P9L93_05950 [Candidatus Gorgyraea atricola]|nr:hypothetical protein [Candidatus Gorgyraea atricola]